ncbi:MAG: polysaccharide deacetylase family protein [Actinobacteria bacterium]|nr:polysaccharide deacetylase family protein [Actinomycetota bacterium]
MGRGFGSALAVLGALVVLTGCTGINASTTNGPGSFDDVESSPSATKSKKPKPTPSAIPVVPADWTPAAKDKTVYLTFDDGPWYQTEDILDILQKNRVTATFFSIGKMIRTREAIMDRIIADGHAIGGHTWDHVDLTKQSDREVEFQLNRTAREIGSVQGPCMRPPFGAIDARVRAISVANGMTPIVWNVDTNDYQPQTSAADIAATLAAARPGDVVLLHDGGGDRSKTAAALAKELPKLVAKGYTFDSIPVCRVA